MINAKTPKLQTKEAAPNIVARLMGMDTMTLDTKYAGCSTEKYIKDNEKKQRRNKTGSVAPELSISSSPLDLHCTYNCKNRDVVDGDGDGDGDEWNRYQNSGKRNDSNERELHPQEEELRKFKKEFQAWRPARFKECSVQPWSHTGLHERGTSRNHVNSTVLFPEKQEDFYRSRSSTPAQEFELSLRKNCNDKLHASSSPNKIVLLTAGNGRTSNHEEFRINSSVTFQERSNMEDFLEAVSERLKCDFQGKTSINSLMIRGSGIETPYCEKATYPKQIAYNMAKQVQEGLTRDLRMSLLCSAPRSPEFIDTCTRRFLSERLRNVLKNETKLIDEDVISRSSNRSSQIVRLKQPRDTSKVAKGMRYWEIVDKQEMQGRCFRQPNDNTLDLHELPPWRKLEDIGAAPSHDVKKPKEKDRFNLKEKVSSFKNSYIFRNRLFGRKMQAIDESHNNGYDITAIDLTNVSTVLKSIGETHDNFTEVPPSPASFCSSSQEEQWRPAEGLHPTSPLDLPSRIDDFMPDFFEEINSDINEIVPQPNQLGSEGTEETLSKQDPNDYELVKSEDEAEAYIRHILIASGLYSESWDKAFLRGNTFLNPIGNSVFEEVEESFRAEENQSSRKYHDMNHRLLFDVLNESLSVVLGQPRKMPRFITKTIGTSMQSIPCGKELLGIVLEMVSANLYDPSDKYYFSIDNTAARDLGSYPWFGSTNEETDSLVTELEWSIVNDIVKELVKDIHPLGYIM